MVWRSGVLRWKALEPDFTQKRVVEEEGEAEDGGEGEIDGSRPWRGWGESVQEKGPALKRKIDPPLAETEAMIWK